MSITKLFLHTKPYDLAGTAGLFLRSVNENLAFHAAHCPEYARILSLCGFSGSVKSEEELFRIPVIPALYFKQNPVFSVPENKLAVTAESSGTGGKKSIIGLDRKSLLLGIAMAARMFLYHNIPSIIPAHYIVLSYPPGKTRLGAAKTAYGATRFTPVLSREYAIREENGRFLPNTQGVLNALYKYEKSGFPVRFVGFPAYMYHIARTLEQEGLSFRLPARSHILLGGGWKDMSGYEPDREDFFRLISQTLGIEKERCSEFFSAAEHPVAYCRCKNGHFHVPIYSRVIIRNIHSLAPAREGETGVLSFITPFVKSMPLLSVATGDLAALYHGGCGCGIDTPYFELKGRAGSAQIKSCAAAAAELLRAQP